MKRLTLLISGFICILFLAQCNGKKKDLEGVWQLQYMVVNGTTLSGNSLGNWIWEFNDEGGYLTDVAGMREKGTYTLQGNLLTLKLANSKNQRSQSYKITKLDSTELNIQSTDTLSATNLRFNKSKASKVAEGEKD